MNPARRGERGVGGVEQEGEERRRKAVRVVQGGNPVPAKWLIPLIP